MRPIFNPRHEAVLHGIEVDVIDVTFEVRVIADCVLPKPSLPDSRFAPSYLAPRSQLSWSQSAGKSALDLAPARREIGIAGRQGPNGMEMVWQNADGAGFERQARLNRAIDLPQALDMLDKQVAGPVNKREREKEYPAFDCWTPISRHQRIIARVQGSQNGGRGLLPRGLGKWPNLRPDSAHMALIEQPTACAKSP